MKPECISEKLLFNTIRLEAANGTCGTGSFFNFDIDGMVYPTIITNRHVVNDNPDEEMTFSVHLNDGNQGSSESFQVTYKPKWLFHPTKDLCCCFAQPVFDAVKHKIGKEVFYIPNDESVSATAENLGMLRAVEAITMVGYPIGLWDTINNFPIFRHGYTASHPALDFNRPGIGLVDIACFPGSSGSPIYIVDEGSYLDKHGNMNIGMSRIIFLGILFAGPQYTADGKLQMRDVPTQMVVHPQTDLMINLGYYIKAHELDVFKGMISSFAQSSVG